MAYAGTLAVRAGDLGEYAVGDFTSFTRPGAYLLRVQNVRAEPFAIARDVYAPAIRACIGYFAKQRCGDSTTGYHAPCHLDDGRRTDDGKHVDVTGGWHDACDLRKWVDATIYGMIGLSRTLDAGGIDRERTLDELRWGNAYFRKMQSPDGFVMNYCGGDDGNRFTDNKRSSPDDRAVHIEPAELVAQFHFVGAQAAMARLFKEADRPYAEACESAGRRCLAWIKEKRNPGAATSLAAGALACAEFSRATGDASFEDQAAGYLGKLIGLQVMAVDESPRGYFLAAADRLEPSREIQHSNLPLLALCDALDAFPRHGDAGRWKAALELHVAYLVEMAGRSAFGIIPFGIYYGNNPGGGRRIGKHWYRYTMKRAGETAAREWWVGTNAHLAGHGVGLARAARLLDNSRLAQLAQRQLDWMLGANVFAASTVTGIGRNQPALYHTNQFAPTTPLIDGGVMNGLGGTDQDEICLDPGSWNTCEYWTPMVAYAMWLMAELKRV